MNQPLGLMLAIWMLIVSVVDGEDAIRFNRDIRPILSENCFHCHGPDDNARAADLRLDDEIAAKEWAIESGDASASELVTRVSSKDPDLIMPPPESERSLTPDQIETLRRWVDQGAPYEGHWAFIPPHRPKVPSIKTSDPANSDQTEIDSFIGRELARQSLLPAPAADRETLIRRATFDLTGLPPSVAEIDAFLADQSEGAYEDLLDRLLSRKTFGERLASDWLDAARYSDTFGYQVDRDRFVWPWRDWVINAINDNMPYDQFITCQLAGDLLPGATRDQILATTFNRLHPQKVEGGSVPEEFRIEYVADRTQTVGTALMGLTLECCRCHNHKYDPISQREYYQLSAFFDNVAEAGLYSYFTQSVPTPTLTLPSEDQATSLKAAIAKVCRLELELAQLTDQSRTNAAERMESGNLFAATGAVDGGWAKPIKSLEFDEKPTGRNQLVGGIAGKAFQLTGDDVVSTDIGNFSRSQPFSIALWIKTPDVKERAVILHRSKAWTDAGSRGYQLLIEDGKLSWSLIHFWPGNALRIRTMDPISVDRWVHVVITNDGSSRAGGLAIYMDGQRAETEVVRDSLTKNITGGGGDNIQIGERMRDRGFKGGSVDRLRVFDTRLTSLEIERLSNPDETIAWLDQESINPEQRSRLIDHWVDRHDPTVAKQIEMLQQARQAKCKIEDQLPEIMVMRDEPKRRETFVLVRGAYDHRGDRVEPETPTALPGFPDDAPRNRLGFARWLCDPQHPLTSRVAVNRLWQICFGTGLVRTPEDFGSQGKPPTHPELLDWLAVEFIESGWDVKAMLKRIMMSQTYQRSSAHPDHAIDQMDPTNRWLARFPSYRMSAEMLRDNALAISGRLVDQVGGPPVKPYELQASFKPSKPDTGAGLYRRSLYTYWKRTGPAPAMMALDAAKRDVCRVQRERTSSPLQAFVLLNGPQYVEAARGLAERVTKQFAASENAIDRSIDEAFRTLTSRRGSERELEVLTDLYRRQFEYFTAESAAKDQYLAIGEASVSDEFDRSHIAALTVVVSTLMNFDEAVMKR